MEKKKDRDILSIEIQYDYKDELKELVNNKDFSRLLLEEAIITVENALEYKNFNKVLDTALQFYEQQEEYDECAKLVKLKEEVNESKKRNKTSN